MKSYTKHTSKGDFKLPDDWRNLLGEEVLSFKVSVNSRLKELGMSSSSASHFISSLKTIPEFCEWYSEEKEKKLALDKMVDTKRNFSLEKKNAILSRAKQTCLERYGGTSSMHSKEVLSKRQETFIRKYGGPSPLSSEPVREKLKAKLQQTNICSPFSKPEVVAKARKTLQERTGFPYPNMKPAEYIKEYLKEFDIEPLEDIETEKCQIRHRGKCLKCGFVFLFHFSKGKPTSCPKCKNSYTTKLESEISDAIENEGFTVERHFFPKVLQGKEIDIYVPELKIGFEINGALTHNSGFNPFKSLPKERNYHANKTKKSLDSGIKLFHIWEHWEEKAIDVVKAKLRIFNKSLYARNLKVVVESNSKELIDFYNRNHTKGFCNSLFTVELRLGDTIVQAMSFRRIGDTLEIARNATERGTQVIGGINRLFKHALEHVSNIKPNIREIVSFADRDLTPDADSSVYSRIGFILEGDVGPTMFYWQAKTVKGSPFDKGEIIERRKLQKSKIEKLFNLVDDFVFDPNMSEQQNLEKLWIFPVYNSGCWKFIYKL